MNTTILQLKRLYDYACYIPAIGFVTVAIVGIAGCLALALGALWLVAELCLLVLQVVIECFTTMSTLYSQSDPLIKFVLLVTIGYVIYRAGRRLLARKRTK